MNLNLGKKGLLESTLGKVVLAVIVLVVLIGLVMAFSGRLSSLWGGLARVLRFG